MEVDASLNFDEKQIEDGRKLFAQSCDFLLSVAGLSQLPDGDLPEIAFAGRSNVGKSSLVNALTGRKTLAKTSNTPGRTRQLNFFNLGRRLMLVDMPGHGFAKASKSDIRGWTGLVKDYLRGRVNLRRLVLLIDARHGLKPSDDELMDMLDEAGVTYQLVLTKEDKLNRGMVKDTYEQVLKSIAKRPAASPNVIVTSAVKGNGMPELRALLADLAEPTPIG